MASKVVVAFVVSASLTLLTTIIALALNRQSEGTFNWIDYSSRSFMQWLLPLLLGIHYGPDTKFFANCLKDVVVALGDTQLVSGIAILIVATYKFANGSITIYHFNFVSDLAWFSSNTHILSLLVIRSFEESVKTPKDQGESKFWILLPNRIRVFLMIVLAGLLLFVSIVSGYRDWYDDLRCSANCVLSHQRGGLPLRWMCVNIFYIAWSYPPQIFLLIREFRVFWIQPRLTRQSMKSVAPRTLRDLVRRGPKFLLLLCWYFFASETVAVLEISVWFSLGLWWLVSDRKNGHSAMDPSEKGAENALGFGQLVPIFLLLIPILQFFESFAKPLPDSSPDNEQPGIHQLTESIPSSGSRVSGFGVS